MNLLLILLGLTLSYSPQKVITTVSSPDGNLKLNLATFEDNLGFSLSMNGVTVVEQSTLSMLIDGKEITGEVKTGRIKKGEENYDYPTLGLHSIARNRCNVASAEITSKKSGTKFTLEVKVFNDAAAFRFIVPGDESSARKPDEASVFKIPSGSTAWYHDLYMHYEGVHTRKLIDTIPAGQWAAPPMTIKLPDGAGYLSITEANLVGYAGMALQTDGKGGFVTRLGHSHPASYPYILRYTKEDVERLSEIAEIKGTITTPWRVIIAGKDLNTIVNTDVIQNLCEAPDKNLFPEGVKTDWIRPGRAVWRYLDGGGDNSTFNMMKFSRKAFEMGFEYNILENFWSKWPEDSIRKLVDYSDKLGVGIIVWKNSKDLRDPSARKEFFQKVSSLGIAGIKIDFFDHEAKEVVDLYESIFKEAAALKLLLILHGANKPTGLSRTWPNIMIYEGVRGMEASKLTDRASHEVTIPFTRMIAGPADYSVCHFGERRKNTTWVHQVATAAIFSAPIITYAANPDNLLINPCSQMIKSIPPVWDETIVLPQSEIGEAVLYAQRKGSTWFLSVINGIIPKTFTVPVTFLTGRDYDTYIIEDNPGDPASANIFERISNRNDIVTIKLGEGGGFMARFTPR